MMHEIWIRSFICGSCIIPAKLIGTVKAISFRKAVLKHFGYEKGTSVPEFDMKTMTLCGHRLYPES